MDDRRSGGTIAMSLRRFHALTLLLLLLGFLLCVFLLAPVTLTLDGYSHVYQAHVLRRMLAGDPAVRAEFEYNSPLVPNWLSTIFLAALAGAAPYELALRLFVVLIVSGLLASLYFCTDVAEYDPRQRAQVLIVLLPLALNAYLTLGFYGFLIGSSICIWALGLLLRFPVSPPWHRQALASLLLLVAYWFHPLPVLVSFLYPLSRAISTWSRRLREPGDLAARNRRPWPVWPWVPPALLLVWFYRQLVRAKPHPYSLFATARQRVVQLIAPDALLSISPTPLCGALWIGLLAICAAAFLAPVGALTFQKRTRRTTLAVLCALTLALFWLAPDAVGEGRGIGSRLLLHAAVYLSVAALGFGVIPSRVLTLCSVLAAIAVGLFGTEYVTVSRRMAPAVAELRAAMDHLPKASRILFLGYRLTPSCSGSPLLERTLPERHWAMRAAAERDAVVLNDYEAATRIFPLRYSNPRFASITGEFHPTSGRQEAAWTDVLKRGDPAVDFIVSWGAPSGVPCTSWVGAPLQDVLGVHYDRVFVQEGSSRVALWQRRR